jgi:iron complex transport system permease protein
MLFGGLLLALVVVVTVATGIGAAGIPLRRLPSALGLGDVVNAADTARDQLILWTIRLPRIAMAGIVGGLLAGSGAIMQGLFRNPLADPALVGVASGGALAAAVVIVVGGQVLAGITVPSEILPVAAFTGSLLATVILRTIATREGRTTVTIFLLGGLAIAAMANAALGLLFFVADDRQLRDITFWMLGSLGGATWAKAAVLTPFLIAFVFLIPGVSRGLDLMALGEAEAFHMGVEVERLKRLSIVLISAMTGAAVAFAGVIGFVGIVVPHVVRLAIGPGHRHLLPASVLSGALLLLAADTVARVIAAPAEVPVGIITAIVGAPFFLGLLLRQRRGVSGL